MELQTHYVVFLRKGPTWTAEHSVELEQLQEAHLANQAALHEAGKLLVGGLVDAGESSDMRGINIFDAEQFDSLDDIREMMEADPMFQVDRLVGEYMTWYTSLDALFRLLKTNH